MQPEPVILNSDQHSSALLGFALGVPKNPQWGRKQARKKSENRHCGLKWLEVMRRRSQKTIVLLKRLLDQSELTVF
jgi:hypothetical protein